MDNRKVGYETQCGTYTAPRYETLCFIRQQTVAVIKCVNVKQHYETKHKSFVRRVQLEPTPANQTLCACAQVHNLNPNF